MGCFKKIVLLAGLPRTGSTLLSNILAQNSNMHVESNSALCQVMWDAKISCEEHANEQLMGAGKHISFRKNLMESIPQIYYPNAENKVVLDKCRPWVNQFNINMARTYIDQNIRSIVMVRPMEEVVASYARIYFKNNGETPYEKLLTHGNHLLMASFAATLEAAKAKDPSFLFVSYDDLVKNTQAVLNKIYSHIQEDPFVHNTQQVDQVVFEDDASNNMHGMHKIRRKVQRQLNPVVLPDWVLTKCKGLTETLYSELEFNPSFNKGFLHA
jgi:sulfotransferase